MSRDQSPVRAIHSENSKILTIDPGTSCLGWTLTEGTSLLEYGVVDLNLGPRQQKKSRKEEIYIATVKWILYSSALWDKADIVLIERQYSKVNGANFEPGFVADVCYIMAISYRHPENVRFISSSAVKKTFKFAGQGHESNKRECIERFSHLLPPDCDLKRRHDIIDCLLIVYYYLKKDPTESEVWPDPIFE